MSSVDTLRPGRGADLHRGGLVLTAVRVAFDNTGRAVEYGHHCFRPDLYSFETTLVAK